MLTLDKRSKLKLNSKDNQLLLKELTEKKNPNNSDLNIFFKNSIEVSNRVRNNNFYFNLPKGY